MSANYFSKRHFKRLVKRKIESYNLPIINKKEEEINKIKNKQTCFSKNGEVLDESDNAGCSIVFEENITENINNNEDEIDEKEPLAKKLAIWAIKSRVTRNTCNELLAILSDEKLDVSRTKKGLLAKYQPIDISVVEMSPGEYFHYGLEKALKIEAQQVNVEGDSLLLDIFCDGLPLYKSSSKSLWSILGAISNCAISSPFLIGTYIVGSSKPPNVEQYLKKFIDEYTALQENGIFLCQKWFKPEIRLIICDAPAKAFLTGTVGHTCSHGCSKCEQTAVRKNNRLAYSLKLGELRTDQSFVDRKSKEFHQLRFHTTSHPLEKCGVKMITQFPLDAMHLLDLGVVKKTLTLMWKRKQLKKSTNLLDKLVINQRMKMISKSTPKEFSRKGRSFDELPRWKATEFRQVILYTGFVLLKNMVDSDLYDHFLHLMSAYRFMSFPNHSETNLNCVQQLLEAFVEDFGSLYGEDLVSYNVHNLLHITECVRNYGCVHNFSSYKFENFLQQLKKDCRKATKIAQQINNRTTERSLISRDTKKVTPLGKILGNMYSKYEFGKFVLINKFPDCFCLTKDLDILKVSSFLEEDSQHFAVGKLFNDVTSSFDYPVDSRSALGISKASYLNELDTKINVNEIYCKLFPIADDNYFHFVPILHHCI